MRAKASAGVHRLRGARESAPLFENSSSARALRPVVLEPAARAEP